MIISFCRIACLQLLGACLFFWTYSLRSFNVRPKNTREIVNFGRDQSSIIQSQTQSNAVLLLDHLIYSRNSNKHIFQLFSSKVDKDKEKSTVVDTDFPDAKRKILELQGKVSGFMADVIDYKSLVEQIKDLEEESSQGGFWDDQSRAQDVLGKLNRVKAQVTRVDKWTRWSEDLDTLLVMAHEDPDEITTYIEVCFFINVFLTVQF